MPVKQGVARVAIMLVQILPKKPSPPIASLAVSLVAGKGRGMNRKRDYLKRIILWFLKAHHWHKDWLGCWKCEYKMRNKIYHVTDTPESPAGERKGK